MFLGFMFNVMDSDEGENVEIVYKILNESKLIF